MAHLAKLIHRHLAARADGQCASLRKAHIHRRDAS